MKINNGSRKMMRNGGNYAIVNGTRFLREKNFMKIRTLLNLVLMVSICITLILFIPAHSAGLPEEPASINSPQSLPGFTKIAAGFAHTCALTSGGAVKCWGTNSDGRLGDGTTTNRSTPVDVVGLSSGVTALAVGFYHTCAIASGGAVKCWGSNSSGQLGDGTTTNRSTPMDVVGLSSGVTALAGGERHTCAVTSGGGVRCWGSNSYGQLGDGTTTQSNTPVDVIGLSSGVTVLAAGYYHTCAIASGGALKCWGYNFYGQLGDGTTTNRSAPVDVIGLSSGVNALAAGYYHTCALSSGSALKCWGYNSSGQLGDGTTTNRRAPVDVVGLASGVTALAAGYSHTCAIASGGALKCWGFNSHGQLGDGTTTDRSTPVDVVGLSNGVTALAVGGYHTCAIASGGAVKCWGFNFSGQLGDGTTTQRSTPVDVIGLSSGVIALAAGYSHTCTIASDGGLKCWGDNSNGQLGDGTTISNSMPVDVVGLASDMTVLAAGGYHTCAIASGGALKCWGYNSYGQLGDGTTTNRSAPVEVIGLSSGMTALAAGYSHTCAIASGGALKCWGRNSYGQLGDGTTTWRSTPVDVVGLSNGVTALAAGYSHTCAIASGGALKCWGRNSYGQLGDGTTTDSSTPVDVVGLSNGVTALAMGDYHTCAVVSGGALKCWGDNSDGQLGDGTTTQRSTPVDVIGLASGVTALTAGWDHTCAVASDGALKCWGRNSYGQLGDGTTTQRNTPVDVVGLASGVTALAASYSHTCALIIPTGRVKCFGLDGYGQLGTGAITQHLTPVNVVESAPVTITLNYQVGMPGSIFTLTGWNFPPLSQATLSINNQVITTALSINETGSFIYFLDTTGADPGGYLVTVSVNPFAQIMFCLENTAPLHTQEGGGTKFAVPPGIAVDYKFLYLPMIVR
jgi:alpha-tubulin suppressor-like RCC1 family protein